MQFCKMHGLGNDFIIFQGQAGDEREYPAMAQQLCNRKTGIGADGILVVLPSERADVRMKIINCDGSEAGMCGNGVRCFARYVFECGVVAKNEFTIETEAGIVSPQLTIVNKKVENIRINMGKPLLDRSQIPMIGPKGMVVSENLTVGGRGYRITSLLMGVPHTIIFLDKNTGIQPETIGPQIENHPVFPERTNVNFVEVINRTEIKVRTWERGAGLTLACGTGCCASVVAACLNNLTDKKVIAHLPLGELVIEYSDNGLVYMSGPAEYVFFGEV